VRDVARHVDPRPERDVLGEGAVRLAEEEAGMRDGLGAA
jgi:hypothetical protein